MTYSVYKIKNPANPSQANYLTAFRDDEEVQELYELIPESDYTHKHRLVIEFEELRRRYIRLGIYMMNNNSTVGTLTLLDAQYSAMKTYLDILRLRLMEENVL